MRNRREIIKGAAALPLALSGAALLPAAASAQTFPSKTVTVIVPFPPGGAADYAARPLAAFLSEKFSHPAVVENKAGAGGGIGHAFAARSEPDGHTIMVTLSSLAVIPEANRLLGQPASYEMDDFTPLGRLMADAPVLAVRSEQPWKNLEDLIADVKANPGKISYGSSGQFGTVHLAMEMFLQAADLSMLHVPFRGGGPAMQALMGGQVAVFPTGLSNVKGQVDAGQVRLLVQYGEKRMQSLPDVPTFVELGYKDVVYIIWTGVFAPVKTPKHVQSIFDDALREFMGRADVVERYRKGGSEIGYMDAAEFGKFLKGDTERLLSLTRKIKLN
jgi:tripartite-type tricarboxylate transporter receptor subunit TctC